MRTVAIVNQKGGVGKTTTACNLGAALARRGQRVLLVDLDAQAHLTFHLGVDNTKATATSYDLMTGRGPVGEMIVERGPGLGLVPSHIDLAGAEVELVTALAREHILREALAPCGEKYDYCLIDCPPSLGLLTLNALVAAQEILVTLQPHFLALQGMTKLIETARLVRQRLNPGLRVTGLVFCMYDGRATLSGEVIADVEGFFSRTATAEDPLLGGARVLRTRVRRNIKLAEAPGFGQTIFEYAPASHGAEDYEQLAGELLGGPAAEKNGNDHASASRSMAPSETGVTGDNPSPGPEGPSSPKGEGLTATASRPEGEAHGSPVA
jgi:chromosome partitioning protein